MKKTLTIEDVLSTAVPHFAQINALAIKKEALESKIADTEQAALEAAQAGDGKLYREKNCQVQDLQIELHVCNEQLDAMRKAPAVDPEEARAVWAAFTEKQNAKMQAHLDLIGNLKQQLYKAFSDMIKDHEYTLDTRAKLGQYLNIPNAPDCMGTINTRLQLELPAAGIPTRSLADSEPQGLLKIGYVNTADPDIVYFMSMYSLANHVSMEPWADPMYKRINRIIAEQSF